MGCQAPNCRQLCAKASALAQAWAHLQIKNPYLSCFLKIMGWPEAGIGYTSFDQGVIRTAWRMYILRPPSHMASAMLCWHSMARVS